MRIESIKRAAVFAVISSALAGLACSSAATNQPVANASANTANASATSAKSPAAEVAAVNSGKELYAIHCMTCHKDSGKGGKVTVDGKNLDPDDLTTERMKSKSDEKMYSYIADGIVDEGMPAFKEELKPDEIRAVVAHLRTLQ